MHYYIIDQGALPMEKFEKLQTELLGLLAEFKIAGEAARVTPLRSVQDLVDTASQRGATTLTACGSDDTFNLMLAALKGRDFTLGFIPLDPNSNLAKILGIDNIFTGAKTIAGRRIEKIDLAKIAGNYFISYLEFGVMSHNIKDVGMWQSLKLLSSESKSFTIRIDDSYNLTLNGLGGLVANTRSTSSQSEKIANPTDGNLDLLILERLSKMQVLQYRTAITEGRLEKVPNTTVIKCKKIEFLEPRGFNLTMLGRVVAKFPSVVEI
ncbi:MAG TPA: diacylglycerol kinase family protein, partial [Candidatus Limnocylindria bacterium]|nr:diacylglycerol kinase family protein [Candidatus Limnocylindria bacterium]